MSSSSPFAQSSDGHEPQRASQPAFPLLQRAEPVEAAADDGADATPAGGDGRPKLEVATIAVFVRLVDGARVLLGRYANEEAAREAAEALVKSLLDGPQWPYVSGRFLQPSAIVSVDVDTQAPKWTGSADRAVSWSGRPQQS